MRRPYVGEGAEGARRSAAIDRSEAEGLDPGPYRDSVLSSEARWLEQADALEAAEVHEGEVMDDPRELGQLEHPLELDGDDDDVVDAEVVLSPREQSARRLTAIAALEKLLAKLKAQEKSTGVWTSEGQKETVKLPTGEKLGNTRTDPVPAKWTVGDRGTWLAYVTKAAPEHLVEQVTTVVDPVWEAELLAALTAGKLTQWLDLDTGEELTQPPKAAGLKHTEAGWKIVTTADPAAAEAVARFLGPVARQLGLPELEAD